MAREGLMDDTGYDAFDCTACMDEEECLKTLEAELLKPYDCETLEELIKNVRNKAIDELAEKVKEALVFKGNGLIVDMCVDRMKGE